MTECIRLSGYDISILWNLFSTNCEKKSMHMSDVWLNCLMTSKNKKKAAYYLILHKFMYALSHYERYAQGYEPSDFPNLKEFKKWIFISYCKSPFHKFRYSPSEWNILCFLDVANSYKTTFATSATFDDHEMNESEYLTFLQNVKDIEDRQNAYHNAILHGDMELIEGMKYYDHGKRTKIC